MNKNTKKDNNDEFNFEKIKFLNIQMIATICFIITLIISYLLSYDKKLSLSKKDKLFTEKTAQNLALFQTILVFIITICFLYVNYKQYQIAKENHDNDEQDLFLQIETSLLAIISAIIGLYIVFKNYNANLTIAETENL